MKELQNLGRSLDREEQKKIVGGDDGNCHTKANCTDPTKNGNFFGNCPGLADLPAGCGCSNYSCPGNEA